MYAYQISRPQICFSSILPPSALKEFLPFNKMNYSSLLASLMYEKWAARWRAITLSSELSAKKSNGSAFNLREPISAWPTEQFHLENSQMVQVCCYCILIPYRTRKNNICWMEGKRIWDHVIKFPFGTWMSACSEDMKVVLHCWFLIGKAALWSMLTGFRVGLTAFWLCDNNSTHTVGRVRWKV